MTSPYAWHSALPQDLLQRAYKDAAVEGAPEPVAAEAADVLYHLLVLLESTGVPLAAVLAELERRTGQSGHAEKAARGLEA